MTKWRNRCTAWVACLAILVAGFMPSISAALMLSHESLAFSAPICSAGHDASAFDNQKPAPSQHTDHFNHCPLCVKLGNAVHLPRTTYFSVPESAAETSPGLVEQEDFRSAVAWLHLPSHAPPARS